MPSVRTVLSHMARMQSLWCARQRTLRHSSRQASARGLAYLLSWGNKPWERLAQRLKDEKVESVYVDRLEGKLGRKVTVEDQINELEQEILQETAGALRRSEDKVNYILLQLQCKGLDINKERNDVIRRQLIGDFNKLRQDAIAARRDLTIHREACGMRIKNWDRTLRLYPVPPRCPADATVAPVADPAEKPSLNPQLSDKERALEIEREKVRERARLRAR